MYIDHFEALKARILDKVPAIKTVDYYNRQYERTDELKAVTYPACYIQFPDRIEGWVENGNGIQSADIEIIFHIVVKDLGDYPVSVMQLAQDHYKQFSKKQILHPYGSLTPIAIGTAFQRMSTELVTEYDQLKVTKIGYGTSILDCDNAPNPTEVTINNFVINQS